MTAIYLIRHGEAVSNQKGVLNSNQSNSLAFPLTDRGVESVCTLGNRLMNENLTAIWASPLFRTQQTAHLLSNMLDIPLITDDRLQERGMGELEGLSVEELRVYDSESDLQWYSAPRGLEPYSQVSERIIAVVKDLCAVSDNTSVAIVSHSAPLRILYGLAQGASGEVLSPRSSMAAYVAELLPGEVVRIEVNQSFGD